MKAPFLLAALATVVLAAACLPKTDQDDGASCAEDKECKSGRCFEGFCAGSDCRPNDSSSCDEGWKCTHNSPDPITGFFGNDGSDTCKPTCGHCPGNAFCPKDAPEGSLCRFGKEPLELEVKIEGAIVGRPVTFTASAKNGTGRLAECDWNVGDGQGSETTTGAVLVRTLREAGPHRLTVSCRDDAGAAGRATTNFTIACIPSGDACNEGLCCAETNDRCVGGTCRVPAPPVLAIEGPTTISRFQSTMYTVKMTSGEGQLRDATWTFADDAPFKKQGLTVEHAFDKTGAISVTVNAGTDLLTQGQTTIVVGVTE